MSGSVNKATIVGNLGNDPEISTMGNGDRVANLSIATSESWKDKNTGEKKERTQWHRVVVFSQPVVDLIEKYVEKGAKLYIEGAIETRSWDDSGVTRYVTEIVLRPFSGQLTMLTGKKGGVPASNNPDAYGQVNSA